ncbi:uncharacterized protein MELLADRAFT_124180 [Melampsora larici-populina 98AG31]|uniref:Secreted protein n=1 Tax=Melampsora larici-populina (strain 98AG31 / pathotype 3-4-7) TaxID=747676 RepID=F4RJ58_MELLP|nr:uncharacterized protein MELLADRAFT_124180 [Melampsora larici-populina 98AG31]EGG07710.1 secreted protein [Melampsora larici-populina 98AG31]
MLHVLPKISLLLLSLLIYELDGREAVSNTKYACNAGYAIDTDKHPVCKVGYPQTKKYKCSPESCKGDDGDRAPFVRMDSCQLITSNGGTDGGDLEEDCLQYDFDEAQRNFNCGTSDLTSYACYESPFSIKPIVCTDCKIMK